jgi:hypothetical protein
MSDAEYFLIAWAVIATVIAGVYANRTKKQEFQNQVLMETIHEIGMGTAKVTIRGNRVIVERGDDDGDNTSK